MKKKFKATVFIGRFQPIHIGQLYAIETALKSSETLILVIGSYNRAKSIKNPFSYSERVQIIKDAIVEHMSSDHILDRIKFVSVRDYLYNDYKWTSEIYSKCIEAGATDDERTQLIGCMKDDASYHLRMFPKWEFNRIPYLDKINATDIRNEWYETGKINRYCEYLKTSTIQTMEQQTLRSDDWFTQLHAEYEFLKSHDEMWKDAPYPVTFTTVDALVIRSGCVLVVKRGTQLGYGQYALPGGYINPKETLLNGMLRELKEETKITVPIHVLKNSIEEVKVFDHPKRSLRGRIITHVHLINLGHGELPDVKGGDDANSAHWLPVADVLQNENQFFEDHYDIIVNLISKY